MQAAINRIRSAMQERGINQRQLAILMGCSETVVSKWFNKPQNFTIAYINKIESALGISILQVTDPSFPASVFSNYEPNKYKFSESLFWEYDTKDFIPSEHKSIVVARVSERGRLNDFYAAFDACGGINGFRDVYMKLKTVDKYSMGFICTALNIKKEDLSCSV